MAQFCGIIYMILGLITCLEDQNAGLAIYVSGITMAYCGYVDNKLRRLENIDPWRDVP